MARRSPPAPAGLTRRRVLAVGVGAAIARGARAVAGPPARAPRPELPRTLEVAVASIEGLISPEAIDKVAETPGELQHEYRVGFNHVRRQRWGEPYSFEQAETVAGALKDECAAAGFGPHELTDYLISTIAWRRRGRLIDVAAQLAPFREQRRREKEQEAKAEEIERRTGVRVKSHCYLELLDLVYFARGAAKPSPGQDPLIDAIAKTLVGNPQMVHVEVQAHAATDEADPVGLSRVRALAVVEALVHLGVPAERLTAHGVGSRFPDREPQRKGRDANRRAELLIMRRSTQ